MKQNMCSCRKPSEDLQDVATEQLPFGCLCDVDSWGCLANVKPICKSYEASPVWLEEGDTTCIHCDHARDCHQVASPLKTVNNP